MTGQKIKVAYLCHEFPKLTETFVYREIERLRRRGMDVLVFAMKRPSRPDAIDNVEEKMKSACYLAPDFSPRFILKSPLLYLGLLWTVFRVDSHKSAVGARVRLGFFLRGALVALELADRPDIKALHCPFTGDEIVAAHVASVLADVPLSFTIHAPLPLYRFSPLLAKQAGRAAFIATISADARRRLIEFVGSEIENRVKIVRCGVDLPGNFVPLDENAASGRKANRHVLSVGSLVLYKGHDVLVRAMGVLAKRGVGVTCEIVGEGPERKNLEGLIRELGIEDRVKLLGGRTQEVVGKLIDNSQLFALASRIDERGVRDGAPVAIMEAMARARPCVSTRVSGIPERRRNKPGT
jgi:colanic acid/amylovoran biosynthesis glycosyltransferase